MKIIRDAKVLIGLLERGDLNREFSDTLHNTQKALTELVAAQPNRKFSATVKLELKLTAAGDTIEFNAEIPPVKLPKLPRRSTVYFVLDDGNISTEHPQQMDMIGGPYEIDHNRPGITRPS
ncbi:hypothetical protein [Neorhizobium petrolearium]|uniref:Uncharacterized protein n=1 Tax=Neorhizobium petrolearium TaxID=515361 RepID=A0ABY8M260_9HYPH|nr:hypothetical protein [Neorhizobium petrolearium]MCC2608361.1 hypothetical protein [Neorhizobium petrolearium]WGI68640.1 hypothetical protein QEO92_00635 [Neorhizobium petrolearium]